MSSILQPIGNPSVSHYLDLTGDVSFFKASIVVSSDEMITLIVNKIREIVGQTTLENSSMQTNLNIQAPPFHPVVNKNLEQKSLDTYRFNFILANPTPDEFRKIYDAIQNILLIEQNKSKEQKSKDGRYSPLFSSSDWQEVDVATPVSQRIDSLSADEKPGTRNLPIALDLNSILGKPDKPEVAEFSGKNHRIHNRGNYNGKAWPVRLVGRSNDNDWRKRPGNK